MTNLPIDDATLDEWLRDLPLKQVTTYTESNDEFYAWFDTIEGFTIREERFWDDCERGEKGVLFEWLRAAFEVGYQVGKRSGA
jgi:hypothetical protein